MTYNVYFGNSIEDNISVNVNDALQNLELAPRATTKGPDGKVTAIICTAVQCPTGPYRAKGVFGTGGGDGNTNKIAIEFGTLEADIQLYHVATQGLSGRDLYIYVFEGSLVGQDETGRSVSIQITPYT